MSRRYRKYRDDEIIFSDISDTDSEDEREERFWKAVKVQKTVEPAVIEIESLVKAILTNENKSYSWKKLSSIQEKISKVLKDMECITKGMFMEKEWFTGVMGRLQKASKGHSRIFDLKAKNLVQNGKVSDSFHFLDPNSKILILSISESH